MAYKDKDKQREADRARQKRRRDKIKAKGVTGRDKPEGVTKQDLAQAKMAARIAVVQPSNGTEQDNIRAANDRLLAALGDPAVIPNIDNYGEPDCKCRHCRANRANGGKYKLNHGPYKPASELAHNEVNRVPLLGDVDYVGVAQSRGIA